MNEYKYQILILLQSLFITMLIFRLIDHNEMLTNLKAGNGYPCAGHIKLTVDNVPAENALILSFEANFGSALPIGSTKYRISHRFNLFA